MTSLMRRIYPPPRASGSVATLAAMADLRSGNYDTALVVGVELEKTVPRDTAKQLQR